jgi:hypothetical protein
VRVYVCARCCVHHSVAATVTHLNVFSSHPPRDHQACSSYAMCVKGSTVLISRFLFWCIYFPHLAWNGLWLRCADKKEHIILCCVQAQVQTGPPPHHHHHSHNYHHHCHNITTITNTTITIIIITTHVRMQGPLES